MDAQVIAALISAATALCAVILGPIIAMRASKNAMLGPMRQAWIDSLRDAIAEFITHVVVYAMPPSSLLSDDDQVRHAAKMDRLNLLKSSYRLKEKICLLINPKEPAHQELVRLVEHAHDAQLENRDTSKELKAIRHQAQVILKQEWNVVKR